MIQGWLRPVRLWANSPWVGFWLCACVNALMMSFFWNRYVGVDLDGWFEALAQQVLSGKVPYRDFFFWTTPAFVYQTAFFMKLLPDSLAWLHFTGALERCLLAGFLCRWLETGLSGKWAVVATLVSMSALNCDIDETLTFYTYDAMFWAVLAGFLSETARTVRGYFIAGLSMAVCILMKHSVGIVVAPLLLVGLLWAGPDRPTRRQAMAWLLGLALPLLAFVVWLTLSSAWTPFLDQVVYAFRDGVSSKGTKAQILARVPSLYRASVPFVCLVCMAFLVLLARVRSQGNVPTSIRWLAALTVVPAGLAALAFSTNLQQSRALIPPIQCLIALSPSYQAAGIGKLGSYLLLVWCLVRPVDRGLRIQSFVAAGISVGLSLSWDLYGPMAVPGFALLVALTLDRLSALGWLKLRGGLLVVLCGGYFGTLESKQIQPFAWGYWFEPPLWTSTVRSSVPDLSGMVLSPFTEDALSNLVRAIDGNSRPDEPILIFPRNPLFYWIAQRKPCTPNVVYEIDTVPDWVCDQDSEIVERQPPRLILLMIDAPDVDLRKDEVFRGGHQSGQVRFRDRLAALIGRSYELVYVTRGSGVPLQLWRLKG